MGKNIIYHQMEPLSFYWDWDINKYLNILTIIEELENGRIKYKHIPQAKELIDIKELDNKILKIEYEFMGV